MNILDAFPARDLALGGQGGPVTAVAEWILLRSQLRHRVLVDLGRTVRMSYLPAASADRAESKILSFEVGPGMALLDALAARLSEGNTPSIPAGIWPCRENASRSLSNIGSRIRTSKCRRRDGIRAACGSSDFLGDALQMAVERGWSIRDLLCTATCFWPR